MGDFFYGEQANIFSFYRFPKALFTDSRFRGISVEAKVLYGLLLDRMGLSVKNGWKDEEGRVYIIFTVERPSWNIWDAATRRRWACCGSWRKRRASSSAGGRAWAAPV